MPVNINLTDAPNPIGPMWKVPLFGNPYSYPHTGEYFVGVYQLEAGSEMVGLLQRTSSGYASKGSKSALIYVKEFPSNLARVVHLLAWTPVATPAMVFKMHPKAFGSPAFSPPAINVQQVPKIGLETSDAIQAWAKKALAGGKAIPSSAQPANPQLTPLHNVAAMQPPKTLTELMGILFNDDPDKSPMVTVKAPMSEPPTFHPPEEFQPLKGKSFLFAGDPTTGVPHPEGWGKKVVWEHSPTVHGSLTITASKTAWADKGQKSRLTLQLSLYPKTMTGGLSYPMKVDVPHLLGEWQNWVIMGVAVISTNKISVTLLNEKTKKFVTQQIGFNLKAYDL